MKTIYSLSFYQVPRISRDGPEFLSIVEATSNKFFVIKQLLRIMVSYYCLGGPAAAAPTAARYIEKELITVACWNPPTIIQKTVCIILPTNKLLTNDTRVTYDEFLIHADAVTPLYFTPCTYAGHIEEPWFLLYTGSHSPYYYSTIQCRKSGNLKLDSKQVDGYVSQTRKSVYEKPDRTSSDKIIVQFSTIPSSLWTPGWMSVQWNANTSSSEPAVPRGQLFHRPMCFIFIAISKGVEFRLSKSSNYRMIDW